MSDQQPPDRNAPTDAPTPARDGVTESPAQKMLYETLASAQAGITLRQDEARKDLEECDRQRADLVEKTNRALQDGDGETYQATQVQLAQLAQTERVIRRMLGEGDEAPQGGPDADAS